MPILFLQYVAPLLDVWEKKHSGTPCPNYIGAVALLVTGCDEANKCRTLELMARACIRCGDRNDILFENPKTELTHFHNRKTSGQSDKVKVLMPDNSTVTCGAVQRWLEVWLDRKMDFKHHVKTKVALAL